MLSGRWSGRIVKRACKGGPVIITARCLSSRKWAACTPRWWRQSAPCPMLRLLHQHQGIAAFSVLTSTHIITIIMSKQLLILWTNSFKSVCVSVCVCGSCSSMMDPPDYSQSPGFVATTQVSPIQLYNNIVLCVLRRTVQVPTQAEVLHVQWASLSPTRGTESHQIVCENRNRDVQVRCCSSMNILFKK